LKNEFRFCEIVKLRNKMARALGFDCYYDMKVNQAEGFDKATLFKIIDELETLSRPLLEVSRKKLASLKGDNSCHPYNIAYTLTGSVSSQKDPYFSLENTISVWLRSFAAMGISYSGAKIHLDFCDRENKYPNAFCHYTQPAWHSKRKGWIPSQANISTLATPGLVGSGYSTTLTLMHEGGHAAHFANVKQPSPLFSQDGAPTSIPYAETQSMFLDTCVTEASWLARYARNLQGEPIPWSIIEQDISHTHDYKVFDLRAMIAMPILEKRIYETPDDLLSPNRILELADEVEIEVMGGLSGRPLLSIPHMFSEESSVRILAILKRKYFS
jgi:Zn-dependent oligopeptidase